MKRHTTSGIVRSVTLIVSFAVILFMVFSSCFVVLEAEHDCTGEDCIVCECIDVCVNTLRQIRTSTFTKLIPVLILPATAVLFTIIVNIRKAGTPVSRKIQLNN